MKAKIVTAYFLVMALVGTLIYFQQTGQAEGITDVHVPATTAEEFYAFKNKKTEKGYQIAIVAGGCFWCTESYFIEEKGIIAVQSGYTGGHVDNPTYKEVSSKTSGHAEGLEIIYDPIDISYERILDLYFESHDPTQLNRQGPDVGPQYRSAIFYTTPKQKEIAQDKITELSKSLIYEDPIVTEINKASEFFRAEEYHQRYYIERGIDKKTLKQWKAR